MKRRFDLLTVDFFKEQYRIVYVFSFQTKNANILGFCWTSSTEIVFVTDQGIEFYQVSVRHCCWRKVCRSSLAVCEFSTK